MVDCYEDRIAQTFEVALSCGCNETHPMPHSLANAWRMLIDIQRGHTCPTR